MGDTTAERGPQSGWTLAEVERLASDGRYDEAEAVCTILLAAAPGDPTTLDALGCVLHAQGRVSDAITTLHRAAAIAPDSPSIARNLVAALIGGDRDDEVRPHIDRLIAGKPIKRILLVNPPETSQSGFTAPPVGLLSIASTLEQNGFLVRVVDGCLDGREAVRWAVDDFRPDLVGITCMTPGRHQVVQVAREVKQHDASILVVVGGAHPSLMYEQMLRHYPAIDCVVIGEGELTCLELVRGVPFAEIRGLAWRDGDSIRRNADRAMVADLDTLPFPAWHLIDLTKYPARGEGTFRGIDLRTAPRINVVFSRGCSGHCSFCSSWRVWRGWRCRSASNMVDEMEMLVRRHGIRHFSFADDALTIDREAAAALFDEIIRRDLKIAFFASTRTDAIDAELLQKMKEAGCYHVSFGVETASQTLLRRMGKANDVATAERAIRLTKEAGLKVTALMIVGNEGETEETVLETIGFLQRTDPDELGLVGGLWVFPGTRLHATCKKKGFISDDFWLGPESHKLYTLEHSKAVIDAWTERVLSYRRQPRVESAPAVQADAPPAADAATTDPLAAAEELAAAGRAADAERAALEEITRSGLSARALNIVGCSRFMQGDLAGALAAMREAFALAPDDPDIAGNLADLSAAAGEPAAEKAVVEKTVDPDCDVTILTVNYNTRDLIMNCVNRVFRHADRPVRMLVVDNGSTDGSREALASDPRVQLEALSSNLGHGPALDHAMRLIRTRYVVVLDSDAFPIRDGWLETLLAPLSSDVLVSGIHHHRSYVHPACLALEARTFTSMGLTFAMNWPADNDIRKLGVTHWDAGEFVSMEVLRRGKKVHFFPISGRPEVAPVVQSASAGGSAGSSVALAGAEYGGFVYHMWYGTRLVVESDRNNFDGIDRAALSAAQHRALGGPQTGAPELSVVITTFNRPELLDRCLAGLAAQSLSADRFEVVVVDDGSSIPAAPVVDRYASQLHVQCITQENGGLASARNAGIAAAKGVVIVPLDDDDVPHTDCLAEHAAWHADRPAATDAMLANLEWAPGIHVTPLMHYATEVSGALWANSGLKDGEQLRFGYLWGGCSSYKRSLINEAGGFNPCFRFGYEDTEAELRMRRRGLRAFFNKRARNLVHHQLSFESLCARSRRQGQSLWRFARLYPGDSIVQGYVGKVDARAVIELESPDIPALSAKVERLLAAGWSLPAEGPDGSDSLTRMYGLVDRVLNYWKCVGILEAEEADTSPTEAGAPRRLLVVAPELPLHDRNSGSFRLMQILEMLAGEGHRITYVARDGAGRHDAAPYIAALERLGIDVQAIDPERFHERWGVLPPGPALDLPRMLEAGRFDAAYLYFHDLAAQYMPHIRRASPATRIVVDSVDIHFLRERRQAELARDAEGLTRSEATRRRELAAYRAADVVVTVTQPDAAALTAEDDRLSVAVVPNVHPARTGTPGYDERRDILFVGGFPHLPNVDGAQWFCREVWPAVASALPDVRLFLVGDKPPAEVQALADDRIVVTGFVPEISPWLDRARVSIAPLRYGAGMKGKVGEAMAAGLPTVLTSVAAEGMAIIPGQHAMVADDPASFAEALIDLYRDRDQWAQMAREARELIEARLSPAAVAESVRRALFHAPTAPPEVSIIIPTFNHLRLTEQCLEAIRANTADCRAEVIVVDNGSTDETPARMAALDRDGRLRLIANPTNLGFARACNRGASAARGRYLLFLNNDTLPHEGWLSALVTTAHSDPSIGVVGSKLLYPDGTIQHAGIVAGMRNGAPHPFHAYLCHPANAAWVSRERDFQMLTGACLMVERRAWDEAGGFDEGYVNGHEDLDLCLKVRSAGRRVVYCPTSVVTHLESRTKRLMGLENYEFREGVENEESRGRRRFLDRWGTALVIDDESLAATDGVPVSGAPPVSAGSSMHILFLMYGWNEEGGGTIMPRLMAHEMARRGHRVSVIFASSRPLAGKQPYFVERGRDGSIDLFCIHNRPSMFNDPQNPGREADDPRCRFVVGELVRALNPDVVHYHSLLGFSLGAIEEVAQSGYASVYTSHNYWPICPRMYLFRDDLSLCDGPSADGARCAACLARPKLASGYAARLEQGRRLLAERVDRHLAVSARVRELFVAAGHDPSRIVVQRQEPGSADTIWREAGSREREPRAIGTPLRVAFIGSLLPQKGVHVFAEALQHVRGPIEGHLLGAGQPVYERALRTIDRAGRLRFHGRYDQEQLPALLSGMDAAVVSSVWDDCAPATVAEALAARLPVVGSRIGGIPDFVQDGANGFLVPPGDAPAMADRLQRLMDEPDLLAEMRGTITAPRGFGAFVEDVLGHYREVLAVRRALSGAAHEAA